MPEKLRVVPLGGLGEIGKNMTAFEFGNEIIVVDAGLAFPEAEMLGVDLVIPDISFLLENRDKVRGIFLTHGHEDHIGGLPYVVRELDVPVYGTRLTLGVARAKMADQGSNAFLDARVVTVGQTVRCGAFRVEFFRVNHSAADCAGLAIHTPVGTVIHTGDFKLDQTPVDGNLTDFHRLAEFGANGVLLLLSDSTNADRPGYTPSEKLVGGTLNRIMVNAPGRVLVASFASHVPRIQQVIDAAASNGRKVGVVGRSMETVVQVANELGYLRIPQGLLVTVEELDLLPRSRVVILTTGSQGEPMSALTRIANDDHRKVRIEPGDVVLIAATPVPGNETMVTRTIDNLFRRGADVIYEPSAGVHVSGHASQEELKLMLNVVKPRFFLPVHGEYRHLVHHAHLAESVGIPSKNIFIGENGMVLELTPNEAHVTGRVTAGNVLVDGLGVGDVGTVVLRDRKQLSEDGIFIVVVALNTETAQLISGPDVISRGFIYMRESEALLEESKEKVKAALSDCGAKKVSDWSTIKSVVKDTLSRFLYERTGRRPMILPIIVEV
ncbi:MAG TPA: ribonuclease J [Firmicutes bacterium]|nr:ribonuclease J [Bacillota bacterium]